jgi:simple sugar transport system permease protein
MTGGALLQSLTLAIPYVLAAMGGVVSERSGVVNIALEGLLLGGAFGATVGALALGPVGGAACGALAGVLLALVNAGVSVRLRADHVVVGLGINLLASGLTRFGLVALYGSSSNSPTIPGDGTGPLADPMLLVAIGSIAATHALLGRTRFGLRLRAVGESPEAARSLGVDVARTRTLALAVAGALGGLGGAAMALEERRFSAEMAAGRGYIALAAVIVGRWRPLPAAGACLAFALADAVQIELQRSIAGYKQFVQMLPYVLTLALVCGLVGRNRPPAALGRTD